MTPGVGSSRSSPHTRPEPAASGVTVSLTVVGSQATGGAGSGSLSGVENLTGSNFPDSLTGDTMANVLTGNGGADTLAAGGGANTVLGGAGDDTLTPGAGPDTLNGGPNDTVSPGDSCSADGGTNVVSNCETLI